MKADRTVRLAWTCAAVFAAIAALLWWNRNPAPLPTPRLARFTFDAGVTTWPTISADGRMVAYASDRDGGKNLDLYVQPVVGGEAVRLTQTPEDESEPDFSPDGGTIAYRSEKDGGGIYLIPSRGGEPRLLVKGGSDPRFSPDGKWIAYLGLGPQIFVIPSTGGSARGFPSKFDAVASPAWSPDGKMILVTASIAAPKGAGRWDVYAAASTGNSTWVESNVLKSLPPYTWPPNDLNWTANGLIFSTRIGLTANVHLCPLNDHGVATANPVLLTNSTEAATRVSASRTGRIAFSSETDRFNLWALPIDANTGKITGAQSRITDGFDLIERPILSDDGQTVFFSASRNGRPQVWKKDLASGNEVEVAAAPAGPVDAVSPDGKIRYSIVTEDDLSCSIRAVRSSNPLFGEVIYRRDTPRLSLRGVNPGSQHLAVARDRIVMILAEQTSNIWLMDLVR